VRRTKIVCTIGPASDSDETLGKLMLAGMNVARVNFSHGTHDYHRQVIRRIKKARKRLGRPVAILQDLQGPKIRIGHIAGDQVVLQPGKPFILTAARVPGDARRVSVSLRSLPNAVAPGHPILLADGRIELVVEKISPPDIVCRVVVGGLLSSRKGINLPGSELQVDPLTAHPLQKFAAVHASIHNHFNLDRHLNRRDIFKHNHSAALAEWRQLAA